MGHRAWIGFTLLLIFTLVAGCQSRRKIGSKLPLDLSRLAVPSVQVYQLEDSAGVHGQMKEEVRRTRLDGREVFEVRMTVHDGVEGESRLLFDAESGNPVGTESAQRFRDREMSIHSTYRSGRVMRVLKAPVGDGGLDTTYTPISANTKDWMQASLLVRALDPAVLRMDTLYIPFYQGFGRAFVDTAAISLAGEEQVSVPAGRFDVSRVHVEFAGSWMDIYLEKGGEGRVVRRDVPGVYGLSSDVLIPDAMWVAAPPDSAKRG